MGTPAEYTGGEVVGGITSRASRAGVLAPSRIDEGVEHHDGMEAIGDVEDQAGTAGEGEGEEEKKDREREEMMFNRFSDGRKSAIVAIVA